MAERKLSAKRKLFVQEYLAAGDFNAAGAYRRAGYSCPNDHAASTGAAVLMANAGIQAAIAEGMRARAEKLDIKADAVLGGLAAVAFSDIRRLFDSTGQPLSVTDIPAATANALASVKVKRQIEGEGEAAHTVETIEYRFWNKPEALRDLGRHLKLFTDNIHVDSDEVNRSIERELARLAAGRQNSLPGHAESNGHGGAAAV